LAVAWAKTAALFECAASSRAAGQNRPDWRAVPDGCTLAVGVIIIGFGTHLIRREALSSWR
jgi:hypothetical protein